MRVFVHEGLIRWCLRLERLSLGALLSGRPCQLEEYNMYLSVCLRTHSCNHSANSVTIMTFGQNWPRGGFSENMESLILCNQGFAKKYLPPILQIKLLFNKLFIIKYVHNI